MEGAEGLIHGDRRSMRRFESQLPMRFEVENERGRQFGAGFTSDFSRKAVRFQTDDPPPVNSFLEMRVEWPFLLQGVCRLELVMKGPVIAAGKRGTVVRIVAYEFQTCGERSFAEAPPASRNLASA